MSSLFIISAVCIEFLRCYITWFLWRTLCSLNLELLNPHQTALHNLLLNVRPPLLSWKILLTVGKVKEGSRIKRFYISYCGWDDHRILCLVSLNLVNLRLERVCLKIWFTFITDSSDNMNPLKRLVQCLFCNVHRVVWNLPWMLWWRSANC